MNNSPSLASNNTVAHRPSDGMPPKDIPQKNSYQVGKRIARLCARARDGDPLFEDPKKSK